jgi:hypothetical protein
VGRRRLATATFSPPVYVSTMASILLLGHPSLQSLNNQNNIWSSSAAQHQLPGVSGRNTNTIRYPSSVTIVLSSDESRGFKMLTRES